jgi:Flp pilus assembly pilin Flp
MDSDPTPDPTGHEADDRGAGLVEYALLMALIVIVCISAVTFFGSGRAGSFTNSASSIVGTG